MACLFSVARHHGDAEDREVAGEHKNSCCPKARFVNFAA
jgi:hypothetical protein